MQAVKETTDLNMFIRMLKLTGLWFFSGEPFSLFKLIQYGRLFSYFLTVVLWNYSLSLIDIQEIPKKSYTPIVIWSNFHFITMFYLFLKSKDLELFTSGMSRLLGKRVSEWEVELFEKYTSEIWKYITFSFGHVVIIILVISFFPTVCDVLFVIFSESEEPFYIPMTLEGFLPKKKSRDFLFYLLNIINGLLVITPSIYYVALLTALPATITYIYYELEVFKRKLIAWSVSNSQNIVHRATLRTIISDHNELLRLIKILKGILGPSFSIQNFITSINTGFMLHAAKKALKESDAMLITQLIYFFSQLVGVTFICCYIGEILFYQGLVVSKNLYWLNWYEQTPKIRRDIHMILIATQRPIVIDLKRRIPLKLETFGELMNRAYTIFIILESLQMEV